MTLVSCWLKNCPYYDSRVVIYAPKMFIRLATGLRVQFVQCWIRPILIFPFSSHRAKRKSYLCTYISSWMIYNVLIVKWIHLFPFIQFRHFEIQCLMIGVFISDCKLSPKLTMLKSNLGYFLFLLPALPP